MDGTSDAQVVCAEAAWPNATKMMNDIIARSRRGSDE
jgi:hypothetical protein